MRIEVAGIPAPQGSKRHVGGGRMVESSRAVGPWREAVRAETQRATFVRWGDLPDRRFRIGTPVVVEMTFYLPRPKSTPKRVTRPIKRPDVDKLARAVLDGIVEGGAIADDSHVVALVASKTFAVDRAPGCVIYIVNPEDPEEESDA